MDLDGKLWCAVAERVQSIQLSYKSINRGWGIGAWATSTPFDFNYNDYDPNSYDSMWQMNIYLHEAMNLYWAEIEHDTDSLFEFATWIVKDWGNIGSNLPKTLYGYCEKSTMPWKLDGVEGVSSYSKILSAKNSGKYHILDTRVAAALNGLQLEVFDGTRIYFDVTGGRNSVINAFNSQYSWKHFQSIGYVRPKEDAYSLYNQVIQLMANHISVKSIEAEMLLFDNAVNVVADERTIAELWTENKKYLDVKRNSHFLETTKRLQAQGTI